MEYIYKLIDPNTHKTRYVGRTKKHPLIRLAGHIIQIKGNKKHKRMTQAKVNWLLGLIEKNQLPIVKVIKTVESHRAKAVEKFYINNYVLKGSELTNRLCNHNKEKLTGPRKPSKKSIPLTATHIKTGEKINFTSAKAAVKILKTKGVIVYAGNISRVAKRRKDGRGYGRLTCGGYKWEFNKNNKDE